MLAQSSISFLNATAISYIMSTHNENSYGNYLLGYAYEEI